MKVFICSRQAAVGFPARVGGSFREQQPPLLGAPRGLGGGGMARRNALRKETTPLHSMMGHWFQVPAILPGSQDTFGGRYPLTLYLGWDFKTLAFQSNLGMAVIGGVCTYKRDHKCKKSEVAGLNDFQRFERFLNMQNFCEKCCLFLKFYL